MPPPQTTARIQRICIRVSHTHRPRPATYTLHQHAAHINIAAHDLAVANTALAEVAQPTAVVDISNNSTDSTIAPLQINPHVTKAHTVWLLYHIAVIDETTAPADSIITAVRINHRVTTERLDLDTKTIVVADTIDTNRTRAIHRIVGFTAQQIQ